MHYESELAVIIKKPCKGVSREAALQYVSGYTCYNDVTARDLQSLASQWGVAKGIDTFGPFGPVVTDEIDPGNVRIRGRLNGEVVQDANTGQMIFDVPTIISYLSQGITLLPGDVIATGTPSGVGPMLPGDVFEVDIEGVGILTNRVRKG
jgi:2-keto-4-pentenoate hydratase/2-oxohepta-3-ene-1,7-dioic acid hydratase in catechol pathway